MTLSENINDRAKRAGANINTIVGLITIVTVLIGVVWGAAFRDRDLTDLKAWKTTHEAEVKERRGEIETGLARLATSVSNLDDRLDVQEATVTRLSDQRAGDAARITELTTTLREMQAALSNQSGDLKVILAWIDEQRRREGMRP